YCYKISLPNKTECFNTLCLFNASRHFKCHSQIKNNILLFLTNKFADLQRLNVINTMNNFLPNPHIMPVYMRALEHHERETYLCAIYRQDSKLAIEIRSIRAVHPVLSPTSLNS
ncbi:hypothetical protein L9F63_005628, partial [Diploptera punctata]